MRFLLLMCLGFALLCQPACKPKDAAPASPQDTTRAPDSTAFSTSAQDLAIYEVNLRAFNGATFVQFTPQLDSIKRLGCNTVWFMPIHPVGVLKSVGQMGSPYAVRNYTATGAEYGTVNEFKALVAQAHARKLNVLIDWVANHTAWDNAWVTDHPDWYTKNAAGEIIPPAGTSWNDVADLDYTSAAMRQEMIKSMKFWVTDVGVDGFRCDAADMVPASFWKQALDTLKAVPRARPLIFLAEGSRAEQLTSGHQLLYGWDFYEVLKKLYKSRARITDLYATNTAENAGTFAAGQRLRYTTNHDESAWSSTPMALFGGKAGALSASCIAVGLGGAPLIYTGQEVGTTLLTPFFTKSTINWAANPDMKKAYRLLLNFRAKHPALRRGALQTYPDINFVAFTRTLGTEQVLVLVNVRNETQTFTVPSALSGPTWQTPAAGSEQLPAALTLPPYGYKILARKL